MTFIDSGFAPMRLTAAEMPTSANPGRLTMQLYRPPGLKPGAPLVVLLHGCRQDPAIYAKGSGWPTLAARHGFALLLPGQTRAGNPLRCFNWFDPAAVAREGGEVASILGMIEQMVVAHELDRRRVFVTGLSAGGAMTAALLAAAPEVFAGGGIIAGLPFGAAATPLEAFGAMRAPRPASGRAWGDLVRAASAHDGRRPAVSIWQGSGDRTVAPSNAEALEAQWLDVLGLDPARVELEQLDAHSCRLWRDGTAQVRLRRWTVDGMGHGTPISPHAEEADRRLGQPSRFMLASTLNSTWLMARDWGLLDGAGAGGHAIPRPGILGRIKATLRAARLLR